MQPMVFKGTEPRAKIISHQAKRRQPARRRCVLRPRDAGRSSPIKKQERNYIPWSCEECPKRTKEALGDDLAVASVTHSALSAEIPLAKKRACTSRRCLSNSCCLMIKVSTAAFTSLEPCDNFMLWMARTPKTAHARFLTRLMKKSTWEPRVMASHILSATIKEGFERHEGILPILPRHAFLR